MKRMTLNHPLFIILGPSGSGKTRITELAFPKGTKIVSYTTRSRRKGEHEGVDYYFVSRAHFEQLIQQQRLVEYDTYDGHYYGIGEDEIFEKTQNHCAYNVLTFKGFQAVERRFGDKVVPVFLTVSKENSLKRLKIREEDAQTVSQRAAIYENDMAMKALLQKSPNLQVIDGNQALEKVVVQLKAIIDAYTVDGKA